MLLLKTVHRFNAGISKTSKGCWEWKGATSVDGYGKFKSFGEQLAHRVSWVLHRGNIPDGKCVLHKCDNPPCVNPEHLFIGTKDDNNKDRALKGRTIIHNSLKKYCKRGHEFNEENTYYRKSGARLCRSCSAMYQREKRNVKST